MKVKLLLNVVFLMTLTACGFHLKGAAQLPEPLKTLNVTYSEDEEFNAELKKQLIASNASLTEDEASAFLSVNFNVLSEINLAKSSSTGLNIQQLSIQVEYSLKDSGGQWLVKQKLLNQTREFESDSDQLLAKNKEKQLLYKQMKSSLARLLLYQLQRVK